jgi:hypothetical protein
MIRVVTGLAVVCCSPAVSQTGPQPLPDGSLVKGVEGRLSKDGDRWLLELETPVGQGPTALNKGTALELLPSAVLEALVADAADGPQRRYRLSGQVETYRGRVYLFPTSFVPLASIATDANGVAASRSHQDPNRPPSPAVAGPADRLAIPEQIQKRLADYQAARQRSWRGRTVPPSRLQVLLDQVGVVVQDQQRTFFVTDGLGQNAMARVFEVLPCATLESMERLQLQAPEPVRFRVGGLLTEYQGRSCVLLHRAVREYDYGNLGR